MSPEEHANVRCLDKPRNVKRKDMCMTCVKHLITLLCPFTLVGATRSQGCTLSGPNHMHQSGIRHKPTDPTQKRHQADRRFRLGRDPGARVPSIAGPGETGAENKRCRQSSGELTRDTADLELS